MSTRIKLAKAQKLENKTNARCQLENKAMKIKLTNMLRGMEIKKRKKEYAKLKRGRGRFIYIKDQLQGEKNSREGKQRNKC